MPNISRDPDPGGVPPEDQEPDVDVFEDDAEDDPTPFCPSCDERTEDQIVCDECGARYCACCIDVGEDCPNCGAYRLGYL